MPVASQRNGSRIMTKINDEHEHGSRQVTETGHGCWSESSFNELEYTIALSACSLCDQDIIFVREKVKDDRRKKSRTKITTKSTYPLVIPFMRHQKVFQ